MRFLSLQRRLGAVVALTSLLMVPPAALSLWYADGFTEAFAVPALACLGLGFALVWPARRHHAELKLRDGFLVVALVWLTVISLCALPFALMPGRLTFSRAFFEAASGLTTTGLTSLHDLSAWPRSLLFYRQSLHFVGGMGIVILAVAVLPMLQIGGSRLFRAESSGAIKDTRLAPRITETARALWLVYVSLNASCALVYRFCGMSWFDAVTHAFATVATGGFSNHDAGFGQFQSPLLQSAATFFLFISGMSYALHFVAWRRASTQAYFHDPEVRGYFWIAAALTGVLALTLWVHEPRLSLLGSVHEAAFHAVSTLTTAGLTNGQSWPWPPFVAPLLLSVAFIGGCSGSTAGGMKVVRILILFRQAWREVSQLIHPRGRFLIKLGETSMPGAALAAITSFCTLYVACFVVLTLLLSTTGVDWLQAFYAIASCINNMGPGLGAAQADFAGMHPAALWICSLAMVIGRLEVFTVLVLLSAAYWRE